MSHWWKVRGGRWKGNGAGAIFFFVLFTSHFSLLTLDAPAVWALSAGQTGHAFLKVPVSARAAALGEAFAGHGDDAGALEYNPAGIAFLPTAHLAFSRAVWFQDAAFSACDAAGARGRWGGGLFYRQLAGEDEARGLAGEPRGGIALRDAVAGAALARRAGRRAAFGAAVKAVRREIETGALTAEADAWMLDAGAIFSLRGGDTLGLSAQNLGKGTAFTYAGTSGARAPLPWQLRLGGVHSAGKLAFSWEGSLPRAGRPLAAAGVEYRPAAVVALRTGFRYQRFIDVAFGLGAAKGILSFDYAFSPRSDLGNLHRGTLGVKF